MYVAAHNASDADIAIDAKGSVIPAGHWGVVVTSNPEVTAPIAAGDLHLYPFGADGCDEAEAASTLARTLNETGARVLNDDFTS